MSKKVLLTDHVWPSVEPERAVLAEADEVAADVIRRVRAGDWFEAGKVPRYDPITQAVFGVGLLTGDTPEDGEEGTE